MIKDYLLQVKKHLDCPMSLKKVVLYNVKQMIEGDSENTELPFDSICEKHGTPSEVALSFYKGLDTETVESAIRKSKRNRWVIFGLSAALIIAVAIILIITCNNQEAVNVINFYNE